MGIKSILEGHFNALKDVISKKPNKMSEDRMNICKECPLYVERFKVCNANKWINPETNEVSPFAVEGWVKGCGCILEAKTRVKNEHCIINKW